MSPEKVAKEALADLRAIQGRVERGTGEGDTARWPDLEALLRIIIREAARTYESEAHRTAVPHA